MDQSDPEAGVPGPPLRRLSEPTVRHFFLYCKLDPPRLYALSIQAPCKHNVEP
jgi:hypothetical protein